MSDCQIKKMMVNLSPEDFKEWVIEQKDNLKYEIEQLAEDPSYYAQFKAWFLTEWDLRLWQDLLGTDGSKKPCKPLSINYKQLVNKPKLGNSTKQEYIVDKMILTGTKGITIKNPVVDNLNHTTTIEIQGSEIGDGNVGYNTDDKSLYVKKDGTYTPITQLDLVANEKTRAEAAEATKINLLGKEPFSGEEYHFPFDIANLRFDTTDNKIKATLHTITLDNNKTRRSYPLEVQIPVSDVNKAYVDQRDQSVLETAESYTDSKIAEAGKVDDVKVTDITGTHSVVVDKIATIPLTDYARNEELTQEIASRTQGDEALDTKIGTKIDLLGDVPGWAPGTNPYKLSYYYEMIPGADKVTVKAKTVSLDNKKDQGEYSLDVMSATTTTAGLMSASDKTKLGNAQTKVKYSATEPAGSEDGDIWIF